MQSDIAKAIFKWIEWSPLHYSHSEQLYLYKQFETYILPVKTQTIFKLTKMYSNCRMGNSRSTIRYDILNILQFTMIHDLSWAFRINYLWFTKHRKRNLRLKQGEDLSETCKSPLELLRVILWKLQVGKTIPLRDFDQRFSA